MTSTLRPVVVELPEWVHVWLADDRQFSSDEDKMAAAVELSRENVLRETGGPFAALVLERDSGRLVSAGVNLVVPSNNSVLHAEIVAFMMAEQRLASYSLSGPGMPAHELVSSCDPCAMCLAAILWAGVSRVVCGASHRDARRIEFDEGPVFPRSHRYLEKRGVELVRGVLREEAREVLELYAERGGTVYNG